MCVYTYIYVKAEWFVAEAQNGHYSMFLTRTHTHTHTRMYICIYINMYYV